MGFWGLAKMAQDVEGCRFRVLGLWYRTSAKQFPTVNCLVEIKMRSLFNLGVGLKS